MSACCMDEQFSHLSWPLSGGKASAGLAASAPFLHNRAARSCRLPILSVLPLAKSGLGGRCKRLLYEGHAFVG